MKKTVFLTIALLCVMAVSFSGCGEVNSEIAVGGVVDDGSDPEDDKKMPSVLITPKGVDIDGLQGLVVFGNTPSVQKSAFITRGDANGDGIDDGDVEVGDKEEEVKPEAPTPQSPYALYSIDANGNIKLTVFRFEVVTDEGGNNVEMQEEISDALQIIPRNMTDLGDYILFSGCSVVVVNTEGLSPNTKQWLDLLFVNDYEYEQVFHHKLNANHLTYMVRKSDGALFDLTDQNIFAYAYSNIDYQMGLESVWYDCNYFAMENTGGVPVVSPDMYRISDKGNLFACSGTYIYKIVDNGNMIDVRSMTQSLPTPSYGRFELDSQENIYVPVNTVNGASADYSVYMYKASGGFNISDFDKGLFLDMRKDDKGEVFLFGTSNNFDGFKVASLKDCECNVLYDTAVNDPNSNFDATGFYFGTYDKSWFFATYLGYNNDEFKWFYGAYRVNDYSGAIMSYNPKLNKAEVLLVPAAIEDAMREKYDAISMGKNTVGVKLGKGTIELTEFDVLAGRVNKKTFEVEALKTMVGMKCVISEVVPTLYIAGMSTIDGTDVHISVDLLTGQNMAVFGTDTRNVISLVRIN